MGAIQLPGGLPAIAVAAVRAGIDLLTPGPAHAERTDELDAVPEALARAAADGEITPEALLSAAARVTALRRWLGERATAGRPSLDVLDGPLHRALAAEIARRSLTLVRDPRRLLPVSRGPIVAIVPRPADLTPADTSSQVRIELAAALEACGLAAEAIEVRMDPTTAEIEAVAARIGDGLAVVATIDARSHVGQRRLVEALVTAGLHVVVLALRSPHDASTMPDEATVVCGYGIQPPTVAALAQAISGQIGFAGRLPVSLEGTPK